MNKKFIVAISDHFEEKSIEEKHLSSIAQVELIYGKSDSELDQLYSTANVFLAWHEKMDKTFLYKLKKCELIVRYGVGFDNIDLEEATKKNILICNTPDYGVEEVADSACALILNAVRQINYYDSRLRKGQQEWTIPSNLNIKRANNHKIGILGFGRIGAAVAFRLLNFGFQVGFYDPYINVGIEKIYGIRRFASLDEMAVWASILTLHAPQTKETTGIINSKVLDLMSTNSILINTARGSLIDSEDTILEALKSNKLAFFASDVFFDEPPKLTSKLYKEWLQQSELGLHIMLTPHVAYYSIQSTIEMREKVSLNVKNFIQTGKTTNRVN